MADDISNLEKQMEADILQLEKQNDNFNLFAQIERKNDLSEIEKELECISKQNDNVNLFHQIIEENISKVEKQKLLEREITMEVDAINNNSNLNIKGMEIDKTNDNVSKPDTGYVYVCCGPNRDPNYISVYRHLNFGYIAITKNKVENTYTVAISSMNELRLIKCKNIKILKYHIKSCAKKFKFKQIFMIKYSKLKLKIPKVKITYIHSVKSICKICKQDTCASGKVVNHIEKYHNIIFSDCDNNIFGA